MQLCFAFVNVCVYQYVSKVASVREKMTKLFCGKNFERWQWEVATKEKPEKATLIQADVLNIVYT